MWKLRINFECSVDNSSTLWRFIKYADGLGLEIKFEKAINLVILYIDILHLRIYTVYINIHSLYTQVIFYKYFYNV